jgi:hypothetical protein
MQDLNLFVALATPGGIPPGRPPRCPKLWMLAVIRYRPLDLARARVDMAVRERFSRHADLRMTMVFRAAGLLIAVACGVP